MKIESALTDMKKVTRLSLERRIARARKNIADGFMVEKMTKRIESLEAHLKSI